MIYSKNIEVEQEAKFVKCDRCGAQEEIPDGLAYLISWGTISKNEDEVNENYFDEESAIKDTNKDLCPKCLGDALENMDQMD